MKNLLGYRRYFLASLAVFGAFFSFATSAHHSTSGFLVNEVVKIEGTVTQFRWTNPHASIKIDGKVEGEEQTIWTIELTAPNVLINQGFKRTSFKTGDEVVIYANPMQDSNFRLRDGSKGGLYVGAVLANGETLGETP